MTEIDERRCDVCGDVIGTSIHIRLQRTLFTRIKVRLYRWGVVDINPVDDGWIPSRVDVCGDCWEDVIDDVSDRVGDD